MTVSTLFYESETWVTKKNNASNIQAVEMKLIRTIKQRKAKLPLFLAT